MRKTLLLLAVLVFNPMARAAPPSVESIDTLLVVTKAESLMDSMFANVDQAMRGGMAAAVKGQTLSAQQQQVLDAAPAKFAQVFREEMNWAKLRPLYVQIYQDSFDQQEIYGLIAFYNSPAGAAYVNKMPLVMQKSMTMVQSLMPPVMAKLQAAMQQTIEEAKAAK